MQEGGVAAGRGASSHPPTAVIDPREGAPIVPGESETLASYRALDAAAGPSARHRVEIGGGTFCVAPGSCFTGNVYVGDKTSIFDLEDRLRDELAHRPGAYLDSFYHTHLEGVPASETPSGADQLVSQRLGVHGFLRTGEGKFLEFTSRGVRQIGTFPRPSTGGPLDTQVGRAISSRYTP